MEVTALFDRWFLILSGKDTAYPWQRRLFERFASADWPRTVCLPTGAGKTSVIPIWLAARAAGAPVPRRLVWVVDRRVVVDQATEEAKQVRDRLALHPEMQEAIGPLAISTLRGEMADNREWSEDPARPAIIVGTVDMVGSRLLFSGYGDGKWYGPQHAGLLGTDTLIVNDEAHLTPAFARLLESAERMQPASANFRVVLLTATPRGNGPAWPPGISEDLDSCAPFRHRLTAKKAIHIVTTKRLDDEMIALAVAGNGGPRRLLFVRSPEKAAELAGRIGKKADSGRVIVLTGTMRGFERDQLTQHPVFQEFQHSEVPDQRCWLVATSAAEVGVDISSDVLITDLDTADHLLQRFGRLNRFGETEGAAYVVTSETEKDPAKLAALAYLRELPDVSCATLFERQAPAEAMSKEPAMAVLDNRVVELWSQTSLGRCQAKPAVEAWLHGKQDDYPQTEVVWREDVHWLAQAGVNGEEREEVLRRHRVLAHEKLREPTNSLVKKLSDLRPDTQVVVMSSAGDVEACSLTDALPRLGYATLLLPIGCGGLLREMFSAEPEAAVTDVADLRGEPARARFLWEKVRPVWRRIGTEETLEEQPDGYLVEVPGDEEDAEPAARMVYQREPSAKKKSSGPIYLEDHQSSVAAAARRLTERLGFPADLIAAFGRAGELHDQGKARAVWQDAVGGDVTRPLAKSNGAMRPWQMAGFRHEFASALDAHSKLGEFSDDLRDLILHLIASHHGWSRPYFPPRAWDRTRLKRSEREALECTRRFARLQARYGAWGLAYLEAIFKAADVMVSRIEGGEQPIYA